MTQLFEPLTFTRGPGMKNRFMLAPLTNTQSHEDGTLSHEEFVWLTMRAQGGYGTTMTCAAHVQAIGQGFPGQLGCFDEIHLEGLTRLATSLHEKGSVSSIQIHHAGMRSPRELIGTTPVCPSANEKSGARELSLEETRQLIEDFIRAAERADEAGFDGVEIHGAHGYIICQYLSDEINQRNDDYGGSLENRSRILFDIIDGIRSRCRPDFQLGVRLSPERFGMKLEDARQISQRLFDENQIDYLDMSLWDIFKHPVEEAYRDRSLISYFTELDRGNTRLGVAGKIFYPSDAEQALALGADFIVQGRAGILHHDYPKKLQASADFQPVSLPVTREYLRNEGLSDAFLEYMSRWPDFIEG